MKISLIAHTPDPEKVVAAAAKLCYSNASIDNLLSGLTPEKSREFVERLAKLGHESPTEHVSFTFAIEGVSRSLLAQITRHRIASYSVQSQRYVNMNQMDAIVPPVIESDESLKQDYDSFMQESLDVYSGFVDRLKQKYVADGMDEKTAVKTAQEDARFVLPNACDTKMIVTMNARSLQNFFRHRCCNRAQWEIRDLADEMLRLVYPIAPSLFKMSGPGCVSGACPEGTMSCGKAVAMREKYDTLKAEEEAVGQWQEN